MMVSLQSKLKESACVTDLGVATVGRASGSPSQMMFKGPRLHDTDGDSNWALVGLGTSERQFPPLSGAT